MCTTDLVMFTRKEKQKIFKNEAELDRFKKFKKATRDTWVVACLSCHRVLKTTEGRAFHFAPLKQELEGTGLWGKCIKHKDDPPRDFRDSEE